MSGRKEKGSRLEVSTEDVVGNSVEAVVEQNDTLSLSDSFNWLYSETSEPSKRSFFEQSTQVGKSLLTLQEMLLK